MKVAFSLGGADEAVLQPKWLGHSLASRAGRLRRDHINRATPLPQSTANITSHCGRYASGLRDEEAKDGPGARGGAIRDALQPSLSGLQYPAMEQNQLGAQTGEWRMN